MLGYFLRRVQRFILPFKIVAIFGGAGTLAYLVLKTPPELVNILVFSLVLFVTLSCILSFLLTASRSLLTALTVAFVVFLKAVDLLSPLNLGLLIVFLVLLSLYLWKK